MLKEVAKNQYLMKQSINSNSFDEEHFCFRTEIDASYIPADQHVYPVINKVLYHKII